jgi:cell division protein FtsB
MANTNRRIAYSDVAYPELHPVTERHYRRQPVKSHNRKHASRNEQILYLLINAALLFGLAQCARALVTDGVNLSLLSSSQASVQNYYSQTRQENQLLQDKIRLYSSPSGIEELARNHLNMVGRNELPIRFQ